MKPYLIKGTVKKKLPGLPIHQMQERKVEKQVHMRNGRKNSSMTKPKMWASMVAPKWTKKNLSKPYETIEGTYSVHFPYLQNGT